MLQNHELDDGLLRFCGQLSNAALDGYSETVNLGPLFSCCGAAIDAAAAASSTQECSPASPPMQNWYKTWHRVATGGRWCLTEPFARAFYCWSSATE